MRENLSFRIVTLGCKVNQADSISLGRELVMRGLVPWDGCGNPWLTVVNTCAVTQESMKKSRKAVRKSNSVGADRLVVTGCAAELHPEQFQDIPGVTGIYSPLDGGNKKRFLEGVGDVSLSRSRAWGYVKSTLHPSRMRVPVKVQDGCDRRCAYCVVPQVRGRSRCRPINNIAEEVVGLSRVGVKEVVLTGIDLGRYDDPCTREGLPELLEYLLLRTNGVRFRLSSLELDGVDDGLVNLIAREKRICRHLHIPLQSGDASVLRAMGRTYQPEEYLSRLKRARDKVPGIAITTDMMVGFPGEKDDNFRQSIEFVRIAGFAKVHVFRYSRRPETPISKIKDDVEPAEKARRAKALAREAAIWRRYFHDSQVGKVLEVLAEEPSREEAGYLQGHTDNYVMVRFPSTLKSMGRVSPVRIIRADEEGAYGEMYKMEAREDKLVAYSEKEGR